MRVLYVDDEEGLLDLAKTYLELSGKMQVDTFLSVSEAEQALVRTCYDAIISDYQMPVTNGIEFLKALRSRGDRVPFILFTGKGREEVVIEALNSGADFYVQKGGDPRSQYVDLGHKVQSAVARRQAEETTLINRRRFETLFAAYNEGVALHEIVYEGEKAVDYRIVEVNAAYERIIGIERDEAMGKLASELYGAGSPPYLDLFTEVSDTGVPKTIETYFVPMKKHFSISIFSSSKGQFATVFMDITERKEAEQRLKRQNRELNAMREMSMTITRATSESELLHEICRISCDVAGYRLAWVGMADDDEDRTVRPVAWAGVSEDYVKGANATWADNERGRGPTGESIRHGRTAFIQDFETDPRAEVWRLAARESGLRSNVALPLKDGDGAFGALMLYSATPNSFTADEIVLLEDMARDLSFGIVSLRAREEKKKAEQELRESEKKYRQVVDNAIEGIWVANKEWKTSFVTENMAAMVGYTREEMLGKSILDFMDGDARAIMINNMRSSNPGSSRERDMAFRRKDGSTLFTRLVASPIFENGKFNGAVAFISDVTERKKAEQELKEGEEKFAKAFHGTAAAMALSRVSDGTYLEVNDRWLRMNGWKREEVIGRTSFELDIWMDEQDRWELLGEIRRNGEVYDQEVRMQRHDGGEWIASVSAQLITLKGEEIILASFLDITERKRVEDELQRKTALFEAQAAASLDGILMIDPNNKRIMINQRVIDLYRPPRYVLDHPEDDTHLLNHVLSLAKDPEKFLRKVKHLNEHIEETSQDELEFKNGMVLERYSAPVFGKDGQYYGRTWTFHDITERKRTEEALREAGRKLNLLSSITRHDMNNQLMVVKSNLALVGKKNLDRSTDERLSKVAAAADRISAIIAFAKEYEDIGVHEPVWQDIRKLVARSAEEVLHSRIEVVNDIPEGTEVFADPMIKKVFVNLIDNAVRHGETLTAVRIRLGASNGTAKIVCEDDGVGVAPAIREHLFTRGYGKNNGLGLFLSREILTINGIDLTEEGEPGKGAKFVMSVPSAIIRTAAGAS